MTRHGVSRDDRLCAGTCELGGRAPWVTPTARRLAGLALVPILALGTACSGDPEGQAAKPATAGPSEGARADAPTVSPAPTATARASSPRPTLRSPRPVARRTLASVTHAPRSAVPTRRPASKAPRPTPTAAPAPTQRRPAPPLALTPAQRAALLDVLTVNEVLGGEWTPARAEPIGCATAPQPSVAVTMGSVTFGRARNLLRHGVATHRSTAASLASLAALAQLAVTCGWTEVPAPPLGEDAVQLTSSRVGVTRTLLAMVLENVVVTLIATGPAAPDETSWEALAETALGGSCAAASDGCH